jgi:hypothetical protein
VSGPNLVLPAGLEEVHGVIVVHGGQVDAFNAAHATEARPIELVRYGPMEDGYALTFDGEVLDAGGVLAVGELPFIVTDDEKIIEITEG